MRGKEFLKQFVRPTAFSLITESCMCKLDHYNDYRLCELLSLKESVETLVS